MDKRAGKTGAFLLGVFCVAGCLLIPAQASAEGASGAPGQYGKAEYELAYRDMTGGNAVEGVIRLIELVRTVPGDNVGYADSLVGPAQLLGFGVASLLDWPDRTLLLNDVLKPEEEPSDKLLIAAMQAGSGIQAMALPARAILGELAKSDHLAVRATALYFLGESYYYGGTPSQNPAAAELFLSYPQLEFTRCVIETPVYNALGRAAKGELADPNLLQDVLYWGGRKEQVFQSSPGLSRAARALPAMSATDITAATVQAWADGLAEETDPRARYTVVSLIAKTGVSPERRAAARPGLQALAKSPPTTPDVLRARVLLAEYARADHDRAALAENVQSLLALGVLPCTAERSMYESVMHAAQHASKYYLRYGLHDAAIRMHEALAAKFPDTLLAGEELTRAQAIRANGVGETLELLRKEVVSPLSRREDDRVQAIYRDVVEHTPNPAVRAAVAALLEKTLGIVTHSGATK